MSHSSRQKLFVKELRKYLPQQFDLWIDEKEISIGTYFEEEIKNAIENECDFLILVLDVQSVKSKWVKKEIEWAIEKEKKLNRPFLLTIVLEEEALLEIDYNEIKNKRFLRCSDFQDITIQTLAKSLTSEILGLLCQMIDDKKSRNEVNEYNDIIANANKISLVIEQELKTVLIPHRIRNPLNISELKGKLEKNTKRLNINIGEIFSLLNRLRDGGFLKGIYFDDEIIYIEKESYHYKSELNKSIKKQIAKKAFSYIKSGQILAIDGGSTAHELTKLISNAIIQGNLYNLTIISNSLLIVNELLTVLSKMNMRDDNSICNLYMIGGKARPTSLNLISDEKYELNPMSSLEFLFEKIGRPDIGFLGTNGVKPNIGFSNQNVHEMNAKRDIVKFSKEKIILADPTKFTVEQDEVFAFFNDNLKVITSGDKDFQDNILNFQKQICNTNTVLIIS